MCGSGGNLCGSSYQREMNLPRCGSGSLCGSRDSDLNGLHSALSCGGSKNRRSQDFYYDDESNIVDVVDVKREFEKAFRKR